MAWNGLWMPWKRLRPSAVTDGRLPVHESPGGDDLGAEGQRNGLMPEADAQDRDAAGEVPDGGRR